MNTRLYFLVPDEHAAEKVTNTLRTMDIDDENIHAVANQEQYPLKNDIPQASLTETSDVVNAAKRGAVLGGSAGVFAGLAASALTPLGLITAGGAAAGLGLAGAAAGTWASTLIGVSVPNTDLDAFQDAIDDGQILMLADVEDDKTDLVKDQIRKTYDKAVIGSGVLNS